MESSYKIFIRVRDISSNVRKTIVMKDCNFSQCIGLIADVFNSSYMEILSIKIYIR